MADVGSRAVGWAWPFWGEIRCSGAFHSLLRLKKFPVRRGREFYSKPLIQRVVSRLRVTEGLKFREFPVIFPVSREVLRCRRVRLRLPPPVASPGPPARS